LGGLHSEAGASIEGNSTTEESMKVAYNAIGKTDTGKPILGQVFIDSKVQVSGSLVYKILAYHFISDNLVHFGAGAATDRLSIMVGPPPGDRVVPGSSLWQMGGWVTDVGVLFQGVDNVLFQGPPPTTNLPLKNLYMQLPPRIELVATFPGPLHSVPFIPKGFLKLIWDPLFAITKGLPLNFFDHMET
jgi:hypothetical protein